MRYGHLCHLKRHVPCVPYDFRTNLNELLLKSSQSLAHSTHQKKKAREKRKERDCDWDGISWGETEDIVSVDRGNLSHIETKSYDD